MEQHDPLELIADPALAKLLNVSLRTFARWDADSKNDFPRPVVINGRKFRRRAKIETWLHERALASLAPTKPAPRQAPVKRPTAIPTKEPAKKPGTKAPAPKTQRAGDVA